MLIFPAIDMIDGKVVRLFQGDYNKTEVFGDDPSAYAKQFFDSGARCLHLVDLDGAKEGTLRNFESVKKIVDAVPGMLIELGGGIRDDLAVERCFEAGVSRVILGTAALKDRDFTKRMVKQYGDRIAVGVDARGGRVAIEGWLNTSKTDSISFCKEMAGIGVRYIIYTDISKDGAGTGTNRDIYRELKKIDGLMVTASGGISSIDDILALRDMDLYAAIIGKALYNGTIDLREAIASAKLD